MQSPAIDNTISGHNIDSIASILDKDPIIREKWSELATSLGIGQQKISKFRDDVQLDKITHPPLIRGILELWKGLDGSAAELGKLVDVVRGLGANNAKESLEKLEESMEFEDCRQCSVSPHMGQVRLQAKIYDLEEELREKLKIIDTKDKELMQKTKNYEKLLQEKRVENSNLEEELLKLQIKIRDQECQLDEIKTSNSYQDMELLKIDQEKNSEYAAVAEQNIETDEFERQDESQESDLENYENENGDSELHLAVARMDESAVHKLVESGADLEETNMIWETPLHFAANISNDSSTGLRIIKYLIYNGANVYAQDDRNRTFLHRLVADGCRLTSTKFHDLVVYLLEKNLAPIFNTQGFESGNTPFQVAVQNMEVAFDTLDILKANGVNFVTGGDSILSFALYGKRSIKLISDLVQLGANCKHRDNQDRSLLHIAAECCHMDGIKYFVDKSLHVDASDDDGNTPLHRVVKFGKENILETVRVLLDHKADLEIKNNEGDTALDLWLQGDTEYNKELINLLTF